MPETPGKKKEAGVGGLLNIFDHGFLDITLSLSLKDRQLQDELSSL